MKPCRALILTSVLLFAGVAAAAAQFPPPPGQSASPPALGQSSPFPPPGQGAPRQASPFAPPGAQPAGKHPCEAFVPLRQAAENGASAIRAAGERKAAREEVCPLFKKFAAAESKVVKFMETNRVLCGVPPDALRQMKTNHARTIQIRNNVCSAGPAGPAGPTLSDALGAPLAPSEPPKPGRGTFDTLTGNVLNR
jgi:hypothetical protein